MINFLKRGFIYLALTFLVLVSINVENASAADVIDYEEGVTNFNNTPENSAVIGSTILKPEIGWNRFDGKNPKITIFGGFNYYTVNNSAFYNGSSEFLKKDNSAVFTFSGTKFRIIGSFSESNSANIEVKIDGTVVENITQNNPTFNHINGTQQLIYEKKNLTPYMVHFITIKNLDSTQPLEIDAIDVDGRILTPGEFIYPESITFNKNPLELLEGSTEFMRFTILPLNSMFKEVIWSSSNESIAIVKGGDVTALKEGTAIITAKIKDTDIVATGTVIVKKQESAETESITLDKKTLELLEGSQDKLTATVLPANTTNKNLVWTSSDTSIATVDQNGNVTAIKEGTANIRVRVKNTTLVAISRVTVKKQGSAESQSITLDRNALELLEGSQDKLTATVLPENATNKKVVWTSSNESIATVDQNGNVTAIKEGNAIITAKVENTDLVAIANVIVKKPINESSSAILSITLVNGITKEYDVTNAVLNNYLNWFESAQGTSTFKFSKTISPYKKVTEYIVHDKIASFEVREY